MNRKLAAGALAVVLATALYLLPLPRRGLVGPDEPRYASIAREMAESGDWITPRLGGEPWFEKPAMIFWLGALGHATGLDNPVRLPVALLGLGFLAFFYLRLRAAFGQEIAVTASCILGTAAGWVAYADAGVFDGPLTAFTSAALLALLPWVSDPECRDVRCLPWFGGLLGLGVLSKGLVAPVVAALALLPLVVERPRRLKDLLGPRVAIAFVGVCLLWYLPCYWLNGRAFWDEFIVRHHFERFFSSSLEHVQPWWFFGPVLAAFLLPWTPLLVGLGRKALWSEPRLRFLAAWAAGPLVFFSLSVNKLPGYILPVIPPLAILMAVGWQRAPRRGALVAAAGTLALVPLASILLPPALADGITRAWAGLETASILWGVVGGAGIAAAAGVAAWWGPPAWRVAGVAAAVAVALAALKFGAYPSVSAVAGTREFHRAHRGRMPNACLGDVRRHVAYGLQYYSNSLVPDCDTEQRSFRIEGDPPKLVPAEAPARDGRSAAPVRPVPPLPRQGRSRAAASGPARSARAASRPGSASR